ncbi:THUMP domain-containing protein 2-like [Haliotis cracherodii]|uniref:THUMP domain-containing protein 2-like n=1 Tax=Haliotis cracherodii TaxID=6455 RepID=UPI0039EBC033
MFYCTAGRGTEIFAEQELAIRHIDSEARITDGKVYFKCDADDYAKLFDLKSVERVFVQIDHFNTSNICTKGKYQFLRSLKETVVEKDKLELALVTHRQVTHHPEPGEPREPLNKRRKVEHGGSSLSSHSPTFRVSSKVAGQWGKAFRARNFQEVSQELGRDVVRLLGWKVDLRNPEAEICVHINDESVTVGMPITRCPVSKRKYMVQPGLRSTVAWIMAHLADIQTGDVVVDPMCGKASILVEAVQDSLISKAHYMGFDISDGQLGHAMENRMSAGTQLLDLGTASVLYLPLQDQSVDKIVCDAPFGHKHTIEMKMDLFYQMLMHQMARVLRVGGTAVVMTSSDLKATLLSCIHTPHRAVAHSPLTNKTDVSSHIHQTPCQETKTTSTEDENSSGGHQGKDKDCVDISLTTSVTTGPSSNTLLRADSPCQGPGVITNMTVSDIKMDKVESEDKSDFSKQRDFDEESASSVCGSVAGVEEGVEPRVRDVDSPESRGTSGDSDKPTESHLRLCSEHYIKLGETHAFILVLRKENKS